jgi:hypothetical protein
MATTEAMSVTLHSDTMIAVTRIESDCGSPEQGRNFAPASLTSAEAQRVDLRPRQSEHNGAAGRSQSPQKKRLVVPKASNLPNRACGQARRFSV